MVEDIRYEDQITFNFPGKMECSSRETSHNLRWHEIEAYGKVVNAFRAQGRLTGEKQKVLGELRRLLSIAYERHRVEVRRAIQDEELGEISKSVCGTFTHSDWMLEGRRVGPILQRAVPQTAFTPEADAVASTWSGLNHLLPILVNKASKNFEDARKSESVCEGETVEMPQHSNSEIFHNESAKDITTELLNELVDKEGEILPSAVPEAAVEITCQADAPKSLVNSGLMDEKASLITELPIELNAHNEGRVVTPTTTLEDAKRKPYFKNQIIKAVVTGIKRAHSFTEMSHPANVAAEVNVGLVQPFSKVETPTNDVIPILSAPNAARQSQCSIQPPSSVQSSQNIQFNKIRPLTPIISVSSVNLVSSVNSALANTNGTTVVVAGSASGANDATRGNNTSQMVKNFPSPAVNQQGISSNSITAANNPHSPSTIFAGSKRQPQQQNPTQKHSIIMQSSQSITANNVIVFRGSTSRLVSVSSSGQNSTPSPASLVTYSTVSPGIVTRNRSVRIYPMHNTLGTATSSVMATSPVSTACSTYNHYQQLHVQPNFRLAAPTVTIVSSESGEVQKSGGVNLVRTSLSGGSTVNYAIGGAAASPILTRSMTVPNAGTLPQPQVALPSSQVNSPALASVLEPKRPRLTFMPAAASPSARQ